MRAYVPLSSVSQVLWLCMRECPPACWNCYVRDLPVCLLLGSAVPPHCFDLVSHFVQCVLSEIFSECTCGGFWLGFVGKTLAAKRGCNCGSGHWNIISAKISVEHNLYYWIERLLVGSVIWWSRAKTCGFEMMFYFWRMVISGAWRDFSDFVADSFALCSAPLPP